MEVDDAGLVDGLVHVMLVELVGMHPDGCMMRCLSCGGETDYGGDACRRCGAVLQARRPFVHANHVTQMLDAIEGFRAGAVARDTLVARRAAWLEVITPVLRDFDLTTIPVAERFEDATLVEAGTMLDEALELLGGALGRLQAVCNPSARPVSPGEAALLDRIANDLIEFGRGTCAGCAALMAWRERVPEKTMMPRLLGDIPLA